MKHGIKVIAWGLILGITESFGCAVCGGPLSPRTLNAYVFMTVLLSFSPFLLLGVGLWLFLKRQSPGMTHNAST